MKNDNVEDVEDIFGKPDEIIVKGVGAIGVGIVSTLMMVACFDHPVFASLFCVEAGLILGVGTYFLIIGTLLYCLSKAKQTT